MNDLLSASPRQPSRKRHPELKRAASQGLTGQAAGRDRLPVDGLGGAPERPQGLFEAFRSTGPESAFGAFGD